MTLKQVLTLLGSGLALGGTFMPIATLRYIHTNFFMGGSTGGLIIVILVGLSLIAAIASFYKVLWVTGIGIFGYVIYSFITFQNYFFKMASKADSGFQVDITGLTAADVTYEVSAWIMLFLGSAAILVAAIVYLPEDDEDEEAEA